MNIWRLKANAKQFSTLEHDINKNSVLQIAIEKPFEQALETLQGIRKPYRSTQNNSIEYRLIMSQKMKKREMIALIISLLNVDPQGFEPRLTVPKTGVLPLHYRSALLW